MKAKILFFKKAYAKHMVYIRPIMKGQEQLKS